MKKSILSSIAAVSVFGLVATAGAVDVNIYGASAQMTFWKQMATKFLNTTGNGGVAGCSGITSRTVGKTQFIATGLNCSLVTGPITIRVTSKNSYEGIKAAKEVPMLVNDDACSTNPGSAYRTMLVSTSGTGTDCYDVTCGASDVAGDEFAQESHGNADGPAGGTWMDAYAPREDTAGLTDFTPIVVPFGFFANNSVTQKSCVAGTPKAGTACDTDRECLRGYPGILAPQTGDCAAGQPITDLSRMMTVMIFSGQAWNWADFGPGYPASLPIVACLRHAGSGTHATLDWTVMRANNAWGWPVLTTQNTAEPTAWFNNGSGTEMGCVNTTQGAVGYADADQADVCIGGNGTLTYGSTVALKYNGYLPHRTNVANGKYDDFWSAQHIYCKPADTDTSNNVGKVVQALMAFASDCNKIPTSLAKYWATQSEMVYWRDNIWLYPQIRGASCTPDYTLLP